MYIVMVTYVLTVTMCMVVYLCSVLAEAQHFSDDDASTPPTPPPTPKTYRFVHQPDGCGAVAMAEYDHDLLHF